jgi:hypothetical protein
MAQRTRLDLSRAVAHLVFGDGRGIASTVYGTIVVMATLTVGYASETHPWTLAVLVSTSAVVLWIAHFYAHALSESITLHRRLTGHDLASIGRHERGVLLAAAAPTVALLLGASGVMRETAAVWLALAIGLVTLGVEGVRYARLEGFGVPATLVAVALNLALGLAVVLLKVTIAH